MSIVGVVKCPACERPINVKLEPYEPKTEDGKVKGMKIALVPDVKRHIVDYRCEGWS